MKRNHLHRQNEIITELKRTGQVSVEALATLYETSSVTIRKDLKELESKGLLIRSFGGAILPELANSKIQLPTELDAKARIACAAAKLVEHHSRIVIDSGLTTANLVGFLEGKSGLVVMSNTLAIAQKLTELEPCPTILMPGGTWDRKTQSFQGQMSEQILRSYDFDQLFVGADGIDLQRGTTTFNELVNLSRVMADVSKQVIVMVESKKVGRKIPNLELSWSQIDILVTDTDLSISDKQTIEQLGVQVQLV